MKLTALFGSFLLLVPGLSSAAILNLSVRDGVGGSASDFIFTSTGVAMPAGSWARVGYFSSWASNPQAVRDTIATGRMDLIDALFTPLGESSLPGGEVTSPTSGRLFAGATRVAGPLTYGATGNFGGQIKDIEFSSGGIPIGTRVFVWILNQSSTTYSETSRFAIVSDMDIGGVTPQNIDGSNWTVDRNDLPATETTALTLSVHTDIDKAADILYGSLGSVILAPAVPVPEPSVSLLAIGAIALGMRRRR